MMASLRITLRASLALLLGTVLGGCGGGTSPTPAAPTGLPAGTYTTAAFTPRVTFTLPDGWTIASDTASYLLLAPAGSDVVGIHLFRDPQAAMQDAACTKASEPGVGTTSAAITAWLRERPGLVVGPPSLVTIGGLRGVSVDVGIAPGWTTSCPFADGIPTVPFVTNPAADYNWVLAGDERLRAYFLDLPAGDGTVLVDIDDFVGDFIDDLLVDAEPIVRSFSFEVTIPE